MTWFYHNTPQEFKEEDIQEYFGFVYLITHNPTGRKYIGKKFFTMAATRQVKGKRKKIRKSSDWEKYWGSNKKLQEEVKLNGVKQSEMASSKSVDLLCRTWVVTSINGESVNDQQTVLFSRAGTYFISSKGSPSFWKLKDNDKILYYHPEKQSGFDDSRYATITELTIDKLTITENNRNTELKPFKK